MVTGSSRLAHWWHSLYAPPLTLGLAGLAQSNCMQSRLQHTIVEGERDLERDRERFCRPWAKGGSGGWDLDQQKRGTTSGSDAGRTARAVEIIFLPLRFGSPHLIHRGFKAGVKQGGHPRSSAFIQVCNFVCGAYKLQTLQPWSLRVRSPSRVFR